MEPLSSRQADILSLARDIGKVAVERLAERYAVTPQTIRKDLNELCDRRLLQRVHGGAVVYSGIENMGYEARRMLAPDEKRSIGERAAALVPDNCSLFVNIGTTTEQVAAALTNHRGLMVVTNNINVANILRKYPGIEVVVAGGVVRHADGGIVGEAAVEFINQFKVDYAVIGVSAIDEDGALLDYDYREVSVARAIIDNARHVILVADRMKLARTAPVRIGHISQINTFVTDGALPKALASLCDESGVDVLTA
jgi:DeoR family glycerol-3-phosphate regulon repressor